MNTRLPQVIDDYFHAANEGLIDDAATCFALNARVHDENHDYIGRKAIREWVHDTTNQFHPKVAIQHLSQARDGFLVSGLVSGEFPGSPVELEYTFTIFDEKITYLTIQ